MTRTGTKAVRDCRSERVPGVRARRRDRPHPATAPPSGSPGIRVIVDRADRPRCGIKVGDYFEVHDSALTIPDGKKFCPYAMAAVFPVLPLRQIELPANDWLERKPWICCPDPVENVVMRLDRIDPVEQP